MCFSEGYEKYTAAGAAGVVAEKDCVRRKYRARQLYKNISMLFLFPVRRDLLFTNI